MYGSGTVTDRSLRDAISLENAGFHGTTRRSFPTRPGRPGDKKTLGNTRFEGQGGGCFIRKIVGKCGFRAE